MFSKVMKTRRSGVSIFPRKKLRHDYHADADAFDATAKL